LEYRGWPEDGFLSVNTERADRRLPPIPGRKNNTREIDYRIITYNYGLAWRGLVVFFGIPLPLVVPLGHNESSFYFQGEHLIRVEYVYNWLDAAICGLHSEGPNGFGCIADWH
jgi:hypothetical protein